jgi:rare lipoprotein A
MTFGTCRGEDAPANSTDSQAQTAKHHWYEIGRASWYGTQFQGRKTANGEKFDMNGMTAAHKTLPLGSMVKVTNLNNSKTVIVKINDRGPYPRGRVLDLSYAAAKKLGFAGSGLTSVKIELLGEEAKTLLTPAVMAAGN